MELTIKNKYINRYHSAIHSENLCPFHKFVRGNSQTLSVLHQIINFIQINLGNSLPSFWQSFYQLSSWQTLKTINLVFHVVWLLNAYTNWISNEQDDEYNESKVRILQRDMFDDLPEQGI